MWGTATAAYQIETTQDDDWAAFERDVLQHQRFAQLGPGKAMPGHIYRLGDFSEEVRRKKTDFDARLDEDLGMAAAMKHNAYRFSIAWARLFPRPDDVEPDAAALAHYRRIFDALARHGLLPVVTLLHFSTPAWLWQAQDGKRGFERAGDLERAQGRSFGQRTIGRGRAGIDFPIERQRGAGVEIERAAGLGNGPAGTRHAVELIANGKGQTIKLFAPGDPRNFASDPAMFDGQVIGAGEASGAFGQRQPGQRPLASQEEHIAPGARRVKLTPKFLKPNRSPSTRFVRPATRAANGSG